MKDNYYNNIKNLIERDIIEQTKYQIKSNNHRLMTYHKIGKELVDAEKDVKNKYGAKIVKRYAERLKKEFGTTYSVRNLELMRQFYLTFPKANPLGSQLSWTHFKILLPIKNENKRNHYINTCIEHSLSKRALIELIKNESYERLVKKGNIKLKHLDNKAINPEILDMIKDPILISLNNSFNKLTEKIIKQLIIDQLEKFMIEAGYGFAFMGSERAIKLNGKTHFVDLVFFNVELNCYVVFELKIRELRKTDISQLEFYVNYYDADIKKSHHNPTIGVTITKRIDKDIVKYTSKPNIEHITYKIIEKV